MSQSPNRYSKAYVEQKIIEPLLAFHQTVMPLNATHINSVNEFAQIMAGLLTGSDGEIAFQGPGAMALADFIGRYLDGEEKLDGSYPDMLQGRLLDASTICEKHAHTLQQNIQPLASRSPLPLADGIGGEQGIEDEVTNETTGEFWQFQDDMNLPITEPLPPLETLGPSPQAAIGGFLKLLGIPLIGGIVALAAGAVIVNLTPEQELMAQQLAQEYGLSIKEVEEIIALDPNASEAEIRKRIQRYLQLRQQYPSLAASNPEWLLWAAAFNLSDEAVAYLAHLNNDTKGGSIYLRGEPYKDVAPDVLAAVLGTLTQQAQQEVEEWKKKVAAARAQGIPLEDIPGWDDLPKEVQTFLQLRAGPDLFRKWYGRAVDSLVRKHFQDEYPNMYSYYVSTYNLRFGEGLNGLFPDVQIDLPNGNIDIIDMTSYKNADTKVKYFFNNVEILIVVTY